MRSRCCRGRRSAPGPPTPCFRSAARATATESPGNPPGSGRRSQWVSLLLQGRSTFGCLLSLPQPLAHPSECSCNSAPSPKLTYSFPPSDWRSVRNSESPAPTEPSSWITLCWSRLHPFASQALGEREQVQRSPRLRLLHPGSQATGVRFDSTTRIRERFATQRQNTESPASLPHSFLTWKGIRITFDRCEG